MGMDKAAKESVRSIMDVLFWGVAGAFVIALAFFLFFKFTPYKMVNVHGPSMEPTLSSGDLIVLEGTEKIERDQIAVFDLPESWASTVLESTESNLIKRVVGLPGDRITFEGDTVEIESGGETFSLREPKIVQCPLEVGTELTVPAGSYFLAGDNRVQSFDSMAAWCDGLDPFIPADTIGIHGDLKLQFGLFRS